MNILTIDVEEWFHILDNDSTRTDKEWGNYESRIHGNMYRIFRILDNNKVSASFFVLGWMAEKFPHLVRSIAERGYEVGSHTHLHQLAYQQSRKQFKDDVERSIKTLEDVTGNKVKNFRAPGFSISEKNKWAFEILHELGIEIDCSVFPAKRAHGGMASYGDASPSVLEYNGVRLKEFPVNTYSFMGRKMIYSGGGYFRLLPYELIRKLTRKSDYVMSYIHPRDLDPSQPVIKGLSKLRTFKSYVGLKKAEKKLGRWLNDFEFIDLKTADDLVQWDKVNVLKL